MGDGDNGALGASSSLDAMISLPEMRVFHVSARPGAFDQCRNQMSIALPRIGAELLTRALIVTRTNTRPRHELAILVKRRHIGANLGQHRRRRLLPHSRNGL